MISSYTIYHVYMGRGWVYATQYVSGIEQTYSKQENIGPDKIVFIMIY